MEQKGMDVNIDYNTLTEAIDQQRECMMNAFDYIWAHPEVGYKEWKTSRYLAGCFIDLGYELQFTEGIPGFTAELNTGRPGPTIAIMGELDALFCSSHPEADSETGAVHACGHLIQTVSMLGVAAALKTAGVLAKLSGRIRFIAVPAEETIDLEYRNALIKAGKIRYVAGKIEFLYRGLFDGVDMAMMFHADTHEGKLFGLMEGMDGCLTKHMEYHGTAAHAGGAPHKGINALYAASLGLQACNALRETFREADYVRYHPVITSEGGAANSIPDLVKLDTYVRAASLTAMTGVNQRINRALAASAAALGAGVTVTDKPGNLPFHSSRELNKLCRQVMTALYGEDSVLDIGWDTQSSDVGDLSSLMPVIQPLCMGAAGNQHGKDYQIADKELCVMNPAKVMLCLLYELLKDGGVRGREIKDSFTPLFPDKEEYFKIIDALASKKELVQYKSGQEIVLQL